MSSLNDKKTAHAFASSWNNLPAGSIYTKAQFEDWLYPIVQSDIQGKNVLELGCGNASLLVHMASWNPAYLEGVDLGESILSARKNMERSGAPNWNVVQADLTQHKSEGFDVVYCIGVLHHLKDPKKGFDAVIRNVKSGGKFHCWVYAREGNGVVIYCVDPLRKLVSHLPWWFTKYCVATPLAIPFFLYSKLLSAFKKSSFFQKLPLFEYCQWISQREFLFFRHVAFDQLVTPQTTYIAENTVRQWLTDPGVEPESAYVVLRNGNSWKFGGRKKQGTMRMTERTDNIALTDERYWNEQYSYRYSALFFLFRNIFLSVNFSYNELFRIIRKTFVAIRKKTMLELGCAPGLTLIDFQRRFGVVPFGAEYAYNGFLLTQNTFRKHGIPADQAIHTDIFSRDFQAENKSRFDIVSSFGLIEHFSNPEEAIKCHVNLLKDSGHLVIMIPNLRKLNGAMARYLNKRSFSLHNLEIMNKSSFENLFSSSSIETLFCDYYGTINLGLFNADSSFKKAILLGFHFMQFFAFNPLLFLMSIFHIRFNSALMSPYMLYIGKKSGTIGNEAEPMQPAAHPTGA